jgi:hypothetical protein
VILRVVFGDVELPGQKGTQIFCGGPSLLAHVVTPIVKAGVDESLDPIHVEATEAAREMPEAEQRVATDHRIAMARESQTTILSEFAITTLTREFEDPIHQLNRVIPFECQFRNMHFVHGKNSPSAKHSKPNT